MRSTRIQKNFLAGLFFFAVAAIFASGLAELPMGSAFDMGPGYFPMLLVILLAVLATILTISGLRGQGEPIAGFSWRVATLIVFPIVLFGAALNAVGLVPALAAAVFATTYAGGARPLLAALTTTAIVVGFCWTIFVWALALPIPSFAPWMSTYQGF